MTLPADGVAVYTSEECEIIRSSSTSPVHVLVIPYPARGHTLVSIQLARKLVSYGVCITMANIFSDMSEDLLEICRTEEFHVVNLGIRPPPPYHSNLPFLGEVESVQGETEQLVASLSPALTCIVSDIFLGWTQSVADKFNIPRYVICASGGLVLAALLYMPELAAQGKVPVEPSKGSERVHIPGLEPTRLADLSPDVQAKFGLKYFTQYVHRCCQPAAEAAAGYLINSFEDLELSCIDVLRSHPYPQRAHSKGASLRRVFPVGPLLHDAYLEPLRCGSTNGITTRSSGFIDAGAPYLRWLDKQLPGSVLYVNFGSIASLSIRQIHDLALGLEASKQPFLLVVRSTKETSTHEEALPLLPKSFTAHAQEVGFVQQHWVNQLDVLSHPAVGGFLSHCGWNSVLESICRGMPLLAWPIQADQKLNCRFLVDEAHTAIEVHKDADSFVSREEVQRAVRELMVEPHGEVVRANMGKLRDKVKKAISKEGSVQRSIETFLADLRAYSHCHF